MEQSQGTGAIGGAMSGAATGAAVGGVPGAVIGGVIGGITGFLGGGGEKEAKKAAKKQAQEILRAAAENRRVQTLQANQQVGLSKATTYANNIMDTGAQRRYRNALESEYRKAIMFDYSVAAKNAEAVVNGGQAAANAIQRQGFGQVLQGATALGSAYAGGSFSTPKETLKPIDVGAISAQRR
jgi:hypothetical protein